MHRPVGELPPTWEILHEVPRAVIVTDTNGVVMAWNAAATELYGWAAHEAIGRAIIDLLSIDSAVDTDHADLQRVVAGDARSGDRWVRHRQGHPMLVRTSTRPVLDGSGAVTAVIGVSEDVTAQRTSEWQLLELMEQFRTALEAGGLGTWRWDARSGETAWDAKLEELFGLSPGAFDGAFDTYAGLLHPDDRDDVLSSIESAMRTGERYRVEHRIVRPDGAVRWIRGAGAVLLDDTGTAIGTVGCAADVTEEVERARELERLTEESARAAERERTQRQRLEFIGRINDVLSNASDVDDVMEGVTRALVPDLGTWCSIYVLDEHGGGVPKLETWHVDPAMVAYAKELQERFPYDPQAERGVPAVIRERRVEFVPTIDDAMLDALDLPDDVRDIVQTLGLRSSIAVPLTKGRRVLGALQLVAADASRTYTDDDVALADALAGRIAATIDNIRLREQARNTSAILQRSLLPTSLPDVPGVEIALRYWPAGEGAVVGGDFYDVFEVGTDGTWAFMIGDVCGTGPHAASLTGLARHTARDAAWHGDAPCEVLAAVHRALRRAGHTTFLTAVFGLVEPTADAAQLTIAVGGHPLPLLVRDAEVTPIGEHGTLLGLVADLRLTPTTHRLLADDTIVLYTDGATDMRPPLTVRPDDFSDLVGACCRDAAPQATAIADLIGDAFDAIHPFEQRDDDVALMVLRFGG